MELCRKLFIGPVIAFTVLTTCIACSTQHTQSGAVDFATGTGEDWVVLPFRNHSQTPLAAERAEWLVVSAMRAGNMTALSKIVEAQAGDGPFPLVDDSQRYELALSRAKASGFKYGISGSVEEWRYKSGLDGEPAVGMTLRVVDIESGATAWSASGARSGWSRESLTGNAQKVIAKLVAPLLE